MKIGIISDTHYGNQKKIIIPEWIKSAFSNVDMIVHAGDLEATNVLHAFSEIAPFYAVRGNCDRYGFDTPDTISVEISVGLLTVAHRAEHARAALRPRSKIMVYGHTHIPLINQENGLLVMNPGSPSLPRGGLPASVGLIIIESGKIRAELRHK
jgi:putative phosphoesterase